MVRSRFGIFSKGAEPDGPGAGEPTAEELAPPAGSAPAPEPSHPDVEEWSIVAAPRASAAAGPSDEDAEELVPPGLARNGAGSPHEPVPGAEDWLLGGSEHEGELTSIPAMAAAAEELASGAEAATVSERELEPAAWVTGQRHPEPEPEPDAEREPEPDAEREPEPEAQSEPAGAHEVDSPNGTNGRISLSSAEFDELRGLGMSVTQAKRVIRYREQRGGFTDLDELDRVPGFPREFLAEIRHSLVP